MASGISFVGDKRPGERGCFSWIFRLTGTPPCGHPPIVIPEREGIMTAASFAWLAH